MDDERLLERFAMVVMATALGDERHAYKAGVAVSLLYTLDAKKLAVYLRDWEEWSTAALQWFVDWTMKSPEWLENCRSK